MDIHRHRNSPRHEQLLHSVYPEVAFAGRGLGWDLDSTFSTNGGDLFGPDSFGHTGYTGTSLWVDPNRKVAVILLTNRVHPTRERGGISQVRRDFHNAVMQAILIDMGLWQEVDDNVKL